MIKELPELNYTFEALEPYIDAKTMEIHHTKHHQAYLDKLLAAVVETSIDNAELEDLLKDPSVIDEGLRTAVVNNGGGVYNHNLFFRIMGSPSESGPEGKLLDAINSTFGSFETFKEEFTKSALSLFGSGWTWLILDNTGTLRIVNTHNQNTPIQEESKALLPLDVWEHAYYLKYQNRRAEYISNWWNVVNWKEVEKILEE
jgi:Fe-Mn family superoxide dismutase